MKRTLVPLVLDSDIELGRKFTQALEQVFAKVYIQTDPKQFDRECDGLRPAIVFVNLNITQREESFLLIDKLNKSTTNRPLIYGYLDTSGPELIAHAIENGVQDVFVRPFDGGVIATKITQQIKNEAASEHAIQFAPLVPALNVLVELPFKLVAIDENGFTLKGRHYISKGTKFEFSNTFVQQIFGKPSIPLMITRSSQPDGGDTDYVFYAEPKDPSEVNSAALRRFIMSKQIT